MSPDHAYESWRDVLRSNPSRRATGRRKRSRGQSLVEFAIVFPIFMLVLVGLLDFGFLLYNRISVINAAREGARAASISAAFTDFSNNAQGAVNATAPSGSTFTIACVRAGGSCNFGSAAGYKVGGGGVVGDSVSVTVTYVDHTIIGSFFGSVFNLSSTVQMVIE